jgi:alpha-L-arabinofuranosidase
LDGVAAAGRAAVFELTGSGPSAHNTVDQPDAVRVVERPAAATGTNFTMVFAPRSATVLEIELGN